jgi:hypothetical protein
MADNLDPEFLKVSIASLNNSCHELHASVETLRETLREQAERERKHRQGVYRAIAAYLEALDNGDETT